MHDDTTTPSASDAGWDDLNSGEWTDLDTTPGCATDDVETLRAALIDASKLWLAHDGLWFLEWEQRHGMEEAIDADAAAWQRFAKLEARRIMSRLGIEPGGGVAALARCFRERLWANLCPLSLRSRGERELRVRMLACRVHDARNRKGLPIFPCKAVGLKEFRAFAEAVDPRFEMVPVQCPPDKLEGEGYCEWWFRLRD